MDVTILGGGLAGVSLAYFLKDCENIKKIVILEKEDVAGGLCRTFNRNGLLYDVGPHIFFSKDNEILDFMLTALADNKTKLRRSNRVICNGKWLQYPFENDLSKLSAEDLDYCLNTFMHNPYENYEAQDMLQFFLKTFGEGIVNLYLRPYNEKIWKYDPAFMDVQMVERIPKPPKEDILRSANGETVEGYLHQLHFSYPADGGTAALVDNLLTGLNERTTIQTNRDVVSVRKNGSGFIVACADGTQTASDAVISTVPLPLLPQMCGSEEPEVLKAANDLRYNSTIIGVVTVKNDHCGDNFVFTIPDKDVIFHRLTKLDFLGCHASEGTSYMVEISYRKNDRCDSMDDDKVLSEIISGLKKIGFIDGANDVLDSEIRRFEYTYVVYDLMHKHNTAILRNWADKQGVLLHGRFGNFEYWNMDAIIRQSMLLSERIMREVGKRYV